MTERVGDLLVAVLSEFSVRLFCGFGALLVCFFVRLGEGFKCGNVPVFRPVFVFFLS